MSENIEIKKDDLKGQIKDIVEKYNKAIYERNRHDELSKRCLGAIEVLNGMIGEEPIENIEKKLKTDDEESESKSK